MYDFDYFMKIFDTASVNTINNNISFETLINSFNCYSRTILSPHSQRYVVIPRKKFRGHELTQEDKNFDCDINSTRIAIECINPCLKTYVIVGSVYRRRIDDLHKVIKIIQTVAA